jgi:hypothetical protein
MKWATPDAPYTGRSFVISAFVIDQSFVLRHSSFPPAQAQDMPSDRA